MAGTLTDDEVYGMTWTRNRLTEKLGIDYPIIQGPLGGLSSQRLTAAVSNFGGLGSFGALSLSPEEIKNVISQIRSLTSKPFAMNLWVSMEDDGARSSDEAAFNRSLAPLANHFAQLQAPRPQYQPYSPIRFEDQARILLEEKVPVFSFIFGIPPKEILDECRAKGIVTIGTATTPDEAVALQEARVDAIVASGFEAGGHRGSFLRAAEDSVTGTFSLVPRIADVVDVPVIAAGGIADARGVIAALALGEILPYPLQRMLVRNLSIAAEAAGRADLMPLWAGQSANLSTCTEVSVFLNSLVEEVSEIAGPLTEWSAKRREKK